MAGAFERVLRREIETNEVSGSGVEQRPRMFAETHGAVDEQRQAFWTKLRDHLGEIWQNRQVSGKSNAELRGTHASSSVKGSRWSLMRNRSVVPEHAGS